MWPTFIWTSVDGADSYRLMVALTASSLPNDPAVQNCGSCLINTTVSESIFVPPTAFLANKTYFWQVQGRATGRNGLWSALLAAKGFNGPAEPLAGRQGFYNAMGDTPDLARVTSGLGETWELMATSYKPYPCGFVIHPVLDCVLDWRREHPKAEVTRIVVRGNPLLAHRTDRPGISTGRESQVSVQHAVAAALMFGRAGIEEFTDACVNDPRVSALRRKVEVVRDPSFSTIAAAVEITAEGKVHDLSQSAARGSDANPLSDRDLEQKLRTVAASWNPRHDVQPLIDAVWSLEESADVSGLASLAAPR